MPDILSEISNRILTLSFNRPDKKNSVTAEMYTALSDALDEASKTDDVRVVIIRGQGDAFSAGNDLGDFLKGPPKDDDAPVWHFLQTIAAFEKPIIAAVMGPAVGIGTTLLLHCDLVYAAPSAKFSMPFVNLGLSPEGSSSLVLPQLVGHRKAAEILMFGESFSADEALSYGLVNKIVPAEELMAFATTQATKLVEKPEASLAVTKRLLKSVQPTTIKERILHEQHIFVSLLEGDAVKEAVAAFKEKRKPVFNKP